MSWAGTHIAATTGTARPLAGRRGRALGLLIAVLVLAVALLPARPALAQDSGRIVRVGWFESPFNTTDELGRRSGYAYEYQQKIAAYTGWTYEYVNGSWPVLLQMLKEGKIDLLSDVSHTAEREESMLFSALPMGAEEYYLFSQPGNEEITLDDTSSFEGKTVGANRGSVQIDVFREWAAANGINSQVRELDGSEEENFNKLLLGDIDLYVTLDAIGAQGQADPVCKVGSSDFFFAVSKGQTELLAELNAAMYRIQDENQYYNQQLSAKHLQASSVSIFLSAEERVWLEDHATIRVGYLDDMLAFCKADPVTGKLTGALKDYLDAAADCLGGTHLDFEATPYPTVAAALKALKNGEIDCMFPASLTDYDGEVQGLFMTSPIMSTETSVLVRESDQKSFARKQRATAAVDAGNTNYETFLIDHFPEWRCVYFADTAECLQAIADGKVDCLLISGYRYNSIARLCEQYNLSQLSTGVEADYSFAVNRSDTVLYSILNKVAGKVPSSTTNDALTHYFTEDAKTSVGDSIRQNVLLAVGVFSFVVLLIIVAALLYTHQKRKPSQTKS